MLSLSCLIGAVVQNLCSKLGILSLSERAAAQAELMSLADLTTPYALRAAVGLGLPMLVKDGTTTIEELADCSGAPVRAVGRLVAYLTLKGVFIRPTADIVALTAVGDLLTTEQARIMLDPREDWQPPQLGPVRPAARRAHRCGGLRRRRGTILLADPGAGSSAGGLVRPLHGRPGRAVDCD